METEILVPKESLKAFQAGLNRINRFAARNNIPLSKAQIHYAREHERTMKYTQTTQHDTSWDTIEKKERLNVVPVVPVTVTIPDEYYAATDAYEPVGVLLGTDADGRWEIKRRSADLSDGALAAALAEKSHQASCRCESCKRPLSAKVVVIREKATGRLLDVGTECSSYYLGAAYEKRLAGFEFVTQLEEYFNACVDSFEKSGGRGRIFTGDLEDFVTACRAACEVHGYRPKWEVADAGSRFAQKKYAVDSTWAVASEMTDIPKDRGEVTADALAEARAQCGDAQRAWAAAFIESLRAMPDDLVREDPFAEKQRVCALQGWVSERNTGLIASAVGHAIKQEQAKKLAENSQHYGAVGEKVDKLVTVSGVHIFETAYGMAAIIKMEDADGNLSVWKTQAKHAVPVGGKMVVKGTIKEHDEFRGVKQTVLTRCKLELAKAERIAAERQLVKLAGAGDTEGVQRLVARGAPVDGMAPEHPNTSPVTPLMAAVRAGQAETAAALVAAGADTTKQQANGLTAGAFAVATGQKEVAMALSASNKTEETRKAVEAGKAAFERGQMCAPALDVEFGQTLKPYPPADQITLMKAWHEGWATANLAAPLPDSLKEDLAPAAPVPASPLTKALVAQAQLDLGLELNSPSANYH